MVREIDIRRASSNDSEDVPEELKKSALARARALLYVLGSLNVVAIALNVVGPQMWGWNGGCASIGVVLHLALLVLTGIFLRLTQRPNISVTRLYDLAFVYEAFTAFGIAYSEQSHPFGGISVVAILIVLFPLFVPTTPRRTMIASLVAAAMVPLTFFLYRAMLGTVEPIRGDVFVGHFIVLLFAFFSVIPAKIMCQMTSDLRAARRLGSYELVSKLGSGGMGEVWCARHRLLRRPAAIKLIRADALGSSERGTASRVTERFEREAQVTASLESPHTVALYDFGVAGDGTFYHVMELLRGRDLESMVGQFGPLPAERVVFILQQVCDSLDDAHRAGLIHRDIKPANIVLCRRGRRVDYVKVLDFGLVKFQRRNVGDLDLSINATHDNAAPGTPAFMAPEIALGDRDIDARVDIYALGCVAYWLLTGSFVFDEKTSMGMAVAHSTKTPVPPSQRTELSIPPALEQLVLQCLAKSKEDRPASALALAQSLRALELPEWSEDQRHDWWTTHLPELMVHEEMVPTSSSVPARAASHANDPSAEQVLDAQIAPTGHAEPTAAE